MFVCLVTLRVIPRLDDFMSLQENQKAETVNEGEHTDTHLDDSYRAMAILELLVN